MLIYGKIGSTLSISESPETDCHFVKAAFTKREADDKSPGKPNPPFHDYTHPTLDFSKMIGRYSRRNMTVVI